MKTILVDDIQVEIIEFPNLIELLKVQSANYILKYDIDDEKSVYYSIVSSASLELLIFCIDQNYKAGFLKFSNGKLLPAEDANVGVALALVENDTFLEKVLDKYYGKPKKAKK